jgi:hypothetical protein
MHVWRLAVVFVWIGLLMTAYRRLTCIATYETFTSLHQILQFEPPSTLRHFILPSLLLTCHVSNPVLLILVMFPQ